MPSIAIEISTTCAKKNPHKKKNVAIRHSEDVIIKYRNKPR